MCSATIGNQLSKLMGGTASKRSHLVPIPQAIVVLGVVHYVFMLVIDRSRTRTRMSSSPVTVFEAVSAYLLEASDFGSGFKV